MPSNRPYRILSLDGGGIRGAISAVWLDAIERRLGSPLRNHVDLIAGTSTGGLLACGVSMGKSPREILDLYRTRGHRIFPGRPERLWSRMGRFFTEGPSAPKYSASGLESELRDVFGGVRFGELGIKPTLVTAYNLLTREATVFKNTHDRFAGLPVWEICRATSAAPTYFPAHIMRIDDATVPLVDGGVVANNPTACAIAEALRIQREADSHADASRLVVASLGTGSLTRPISVKASQEWGAVEWAVPIIDVLFDGAADATDYVAEQVLAPDRYFRFQARLDAAYDDMDNADETNINALIATAEHYLRQDTVRDRLEKLIDLLK